MKKIIKISLLILFIIFVFGIATSNAAELPTVDGDTSAQDMIEWLNTDGNHITGISDKIRDINSFLFCNDKYTWLYQGAEYKRIETIEFPGDNPKENNGYAKAYIFAAPGYDKSDDDDGKVTKDDERQYAWYCIIGQETDPNDLYNVAMAYQEYKSSEVALNVIAEENAKTTVDGDNIIYGPIKINYSYGCYKKEESGPKLDEWGGFDYAFFDEKGNNVSNKVELRQLKDNNYEPVSVLMEDGYYKVRANGHSEELHIVTRDSNIGNIKMKIRQNKVNYTATAHVLQGVNKEGSAGRSYCNVCRANFKKLSQINNVGQYYYDNGFCYKCTSITYNGTVKSVNPQYNSHIINGSTYSAEAPTDPNATAETWYGYNDKWYASEDIAAAQVTSSSYQGGYKCNANGCEYTSYSSIGLDHKRTHVISGTANTYVKYTYKYEEYKGCSNTIKGKVPTKCGTPFKAGEEPSQELYLVETKPETTKIEKDLEIEFNLSIEVTKKWNDGGRTDRKKPTLKVYRSTTQEQWFELEKGKHYDIIWIDDDGDDWKAIISGLQRSGDDGKGNIVDYYFKVKEVGNGTAEEANVVVNGEVKYKVTYKSGNKTDGIVSGETNAITITNTKLIDIGGFVWLDEEEGTKPVTLPDGSYDDGEKKLEGIVVHLYRKKPTDKEYSWVEKTKTDKDGYYNFKEKEIGYQYYVIFEYDGINYQETKYGRDNVQGTDSKADETKREEFNDKFYTITYGEATNINGKDKIALKYDYKEGKSSLITTGIYTIEGKEEERVLEHFRMYASSKGAVYTSDVNNLNLGLVKRGTDIALSTDVHNAKVTINGQETEYTYNKEENSVVIGNTQTSDKTSYNLNLYASDYNYRIRDYVSNDGFKEKNYIGQTIPTDSENGKYLIQTGSQLEVYVTYELNLQNQGTKTTRINEVKYVYDSKYTFVGLQGSNYTVEDSENVLTMKLNGLELTDGKTETLYLVFEVKKDTNNAVNLGDFSNKAEITSYSTAEGLIDVDSQPGNFMEKNEVEDDNDTARGLNIEEVVTTERKISGKVFDGSNNVNDVIVQLIELKTVNNKTYEYIWQETVSGTGKGLRLNDDGTELVEYTYTKVDGQYEFSGFIPGDYIVRFIYGDGTTYDLTGNVLKYNGQDYKSVADSNYKSEWYNASPYAEGASVARDNEARRLETMAYAVNIDAEKGLLLKLLDNKKLNLTEKETLIAIYNKYNDTYGTSDITYTKIVEVSDEIISKIKEVLLRKDVLPNTWMCAETSKIKVAVDAENTTNTSMSTSVNGITKNYVREIPNINLGLELRPETKIELKKYITGFKLTAANGQTLVNATIDVNKYIENTSNISGSVEGIKDSVTILNNVWQYEVVPTDINTIIDGASLEFEYTLVVRNTSDTDYLSDALTDAYKDENIDYKDFLINEQKGKVKEIKDSIRKDGYNKEIGKYLGTTYYTGVEAGKKVQTEVTNIRDYVNNDLTFIFSYEGKVEKDDKASKSHRILRDNYSIQETELSTILKTTESTGKMSNTDSAVMYTVTLGKNPISSTGNLEFDTYIAEVMSYTNAAGRRSMTSTPGNAEIIEAYPNNEVGVHEIDEADTGRIQIGVATGEDNKTNYIIITSVIAGIAIIAAGAFVVKKYVVK